MSAELAPSAASTRRRTGLLLAAGTSVVSGVAVFANSYGVANFSNPTAYTALKNAMAALLIAGLVSLRGVRRSADAATFARAWKARAFLGAIAIFGGALPFVLFFEGLARAQSTQAAFIHKTLVVWVVLLAIPLLKERVGPVHFVAIAAVLLGQSLMQGGLSGFEVGNGEWMILAATWLWSIEVILAKRLMPEVPPATVALARMVGGSGLLILYSAATGKFSGITSVGPTGWLWILVTGTLLAMYVTTWLLALARAQAVDVTAILVLAVPITALLQFGIQDVAIPDLTLGSALVAAGSGAVFVMARRAAVSET